MTASKTFALEMQLSNLRRIYDNHVALTGAMGIDRINRSAFEIRLDEEILLISTKAAKGTYKFSQYKEKLISKGANKSPRVISIPTFRDRITLRALSNVLRDTFGNQLDIKLPQHKISELREGLKSHQYQYFIKLDTKDFYPSIHHDQLIQLLKRKIRKPQILQLIQSAIKSPTVNFPDRTKPNNERGVPQGLSISNVLAEIYLADLDAWACRIENVLYFRYVDDILILTKGNMDSLPNEIASKLSSYHLEIHELNREGKSVSGSIRDKFNFLGYEFIHGKAFVKIDSIRRLEMSLAKILTTYKYKCKSARTEIDPKRQLYLLDMARKICLWRLNLRITGCIFEEVRRGWVFYFSQIDVEALRQMQGLDKTLKVLAHRFSLKYINSELKSFSRTFHESKRSNAKQFYIPNFDTLSLSTQRDILETYGMNGVNDMTELQIKQAFKRRIRRETSDLEQDIQGGSRG